MPKYYGVRIRTKEDALECEKAFHRLPPEKRLRGAATHACAHSVLNRGGAWFDVTHGQIHFMHGGTEKDVVEDGDILLTIQEWKSKLYELAGEPQLDDNVTYERYLEDLAYEIT